MGWRALRDLSDHAAGHVPRQSLLLVLANSLRPGTLQLGQRVERIATTAKGTFCHFSHGILAGPFDIVVCASGLALPAMFNSTSNKDIMVMGDARWTRQHWWD